MASFSFWQKWLSVVGSVIVLTGVLMALLSGTLVFDLFNRQVDPAFWGVMQMDEGARVFRQWVYGVWGATIAGWGVLLTGVAHIPFRKKEKWAWNCIAAGILIWFVLDTSLSIFYRVYFNVAFNLAISILAMLPLAFTRREMQ